MEGWIPILKRVALGKAEVLVLTHNDVIQHPDRDGLAGSLDLLRDLIVLAARLDLAGGMIVHEARGVEFQRGLDDLTRMKTQGY